MARFAAVTLLSSGLLLSIIPPVGAQVTKPATPPATRIQRTAKPAAARALTAAEIRTRLFAVLDRMSADQKFEFLGRQLSPGGLRAELQKPEYAGRVARRIDAAALQKEIDREHALKVAEVNRHAAAAALAPPPVLPAGSGSAFRVPRGPFANRPQSRP